MQPVALVEVAQTSSHGKMVELWPVVRVDPGEQRVLVKRTGNVAVGRMVGRRSTEGNERSVDVQEKQRALRGPIHVTNRTSRQERCAACAFGLVPPAHYLGSVASRPVDDRPGFRTILRSAARNRSTAAARAMRPKTNTNPRME